MTEVQVGLGKLQPLVGRQLTLFPTQSDQERQTLANLTRRYGRDRFRQPQVVDAGLPRGVINIVTGPGGQVGAELVTNPLSRKIAFTGSTETGQWIAQEAGKRFKRVTLELGCHRC